MAENKDNVSNDLSTSAKTAAEAAKAAVAAGKAIGKAATGNVVGAAVDVAKNKTLRNIVIGTIAVVLVLFMLIFYAIPSMIFSAAEDMARDLDNEMIAEIDAAGNNTIQFFMQVDYLSNKIGGKIGAYVFEALWDFIKSVFTGQQSEDRVDYSGFVYDTTFDEEAAIDTIKIQMEKVVDRFDARRDQYEKLLNQAANDYRVFWPWYPIQVGAQAFVVTTTFDAPEVTDYDALQYMSAYSIQRGNGLEDVALRSLLAWIGYYNGTIFGRNDSYTIGERTFNTYTWEGDYLPQYQYEQWQQEEAAGRTKTDFDTDAFLDKVYYVDKETGINVTYDHTVEYIPIYDPITGEVVDELRYVTAYMNIHMTVTKAPTDKIEDDVMGFWNGSLRKKNSRGINRSCSKPIMLSYSWTNGGYEYVRQSGYQTKYFEDLQVTTAKYIGVSATDTTNVDFTVVGSQEAKNKNAEAMVSMAESQLGHIGGSPYWDYGNSGDNWCAWFVKWCGDQVGLNNGCWAAMSGGCTTTWRNYGGSANVTKGAYSGGSNQYGTAVLVDDTTILGGEWIPQRGDLVFFKDRNDPNNGNICHIGIVQYYDAETNDLVTIEGNTSAGAYPGQYDSQVLNKHRTTTQKYGTIYKSYNIIGFVRPNY